MTQKAVVRFRVRLKVPRQEEWQPWEVRRKESGLMTKIKPSPQGHHALQSLCSCLCQEHAQCFLLLHYCETLSPRVHRAQPAQLPNPENTPRELLVPKAPAPTAGQAARSHSCKAGQELGLFFCWVRSS